MECVILRGSRRVVKRGHCAVGIMEVLDGSERRGCVLSVIERVVGPSAVTNTPEVGLVAKTEQMTTVVVAIRLLYFSERLDGSSVKASVDHIANLQGRGWSLLWFHSLPYRCR